MKHCLIGNIIIFLFISPNSKIGISSNRTDTFFFLNVHQYILNLWKNEINLKFNVIYSEYVRMHVCTFKSIPLVTQSWASRISDAIKSCLTTRGPTCTAFKISFLEPLKQSKSQTKECSPTSLFRHQDTSLLFYLNIVEQVENLKWSHYMVPKSSDIPI